jgi:hypothetical protein
MRAERKHSEFAIVAITKSEHISFLVQVDLDKERKRDLAQINYHVLFYGNPDTGSY